MQNLFQDKYEALNRFTKLIGKQTYCTYLHNISIRIETNIERDKIPLKLEEVYSPQDTELTISLADQAQYFHSIQSWDELVDDQVSIWRGHHVQRDFIYTQVGPNQFRALIDPNNSDGIYNLLRHLLPVYLAKKDQALIHSSCVQCHFGDGLLFLGHSTYGKSTIAKLSSPRVTLSDDMNVISVKKGALFACPSQLGARVESKEIKEVRLREIFWLNKGEELKRVRLPSSQALLYLMASVPSYLEISGQTSRLQKLLEQASRTTPFSKLTFPKKKDIWNELDPS